MPAHLAGQGRWLKRVQVARGYWRCQEQAGAVRSAGWWESATVTWSPAAAPLPAGRTQFGTSMVADSIRQHSLPFGRGVQADQRGPCAAVAHAFRQLPEAGTCRPGQIVAQDRVAGQAGAPPRPAS